MTEIKENMTDEKTIKTIPLLPRKIKENMTIEKIIRLAKDREWAAIMKLEACQEPVGSNNYSIDEGYFCAKYRYEIHMWHSILDFILEK